MENVFVYFLWNHVVTTVVKKTINCSQTSNFVKNDTYENLLKINARKSFAIKNLNYGKRKK